MPRGKPDTPVEPRESRLLSEYLAAKWPGKRIIFQPRLGLQIPQNGDTPLTYAELRLAGVWRRYPDAVILLPDRAIIVECSVKPDPGKISILELYGELFPKTPEMEEFAKLPVELLLVWGIPDTACQVLATRKGIRVEVYQPQWVLDWLDTLRPRDKRAAVLPV
jgi:hypothetical protein